MSMIRDIRQEEFADVFLQQDGDGILYLCPRFGKCRVGIKIFQGLGNPKVLISYPDHNIKDSWLNDFKETKYRNPNLKFTTHLSLKKHLNDELDILVLDEIHLLSDAQIEVVKEFKKKGIRILGLTGTLSEYTEISLKRSIKMPVLARYSIEQAIKEQIISDYQITIVKVPLDKKQRVLFGKQQKTEKAHFDAYSWVIKKLTEEKKDTMHLRLTRMRILQRSIAKFNKTVELINKFKDERLLIFCGLTDIADNLGCPVYHNKVKEKSIFTDFAEGKGNHLAVIKIGNTGVTYKPLNKVLINYFDSNSENLAQKIFRCMAFEYDNTEKKSDIWIISTDEEVEIEWLTKSLEFFDSAKISYI